MGIVPSREVKCSTLNKPFLQYKFLGLNVIESQGIFFYLIWNSGVLHSKKKKRKKGTVKEKNIHKLPKSKQ